MISIQFSITGFLQHVPVFATVPTIHPALADNGRRIGLRGWRRLRILHRLLKHLRCALSRVGRNVAGGQKTQAPDHQFLNRHPRQDQW